MGMPSKRRIRATRAEMGARYEAIIEIVEETAPTSVRHTYYSAIGRHIVKKDTSSTKRSNYGKIQRAVLKLRREHEIDYADIVDSTRWMRKPTSYRDLKTGLLDFQRAYRRDLWASGFTLLEVWCESESIAGVLVDVTSEWDVPLLPTHGYNSETFAWGAAENWLEDDRVPVILYVGDLDLHGHRIERDLRTKLEGFYGASIEWSRVGITEDQIEEHDLHDLNTTPGNWEAEALPPDLMRMALETAILEYVDPAALQVHRAAEASERDVLRRIVEAKGGAA